MNYAQLCRHEGVINIDKCVCVSHAAVACLRIIDTVYVLIA